MISLFKWLKEVFPREKQETFLSKEILEYFKEKEKQFKKESGNFLKEKMHLYKKIHDLSDEIVSLKNKYAPLEELQKVIYEQEAFILRMVNEKYEIQEDDLKYIRKK